MKNSKILWLIVGFVASVAGLLVMERSPMGGLLLMIAGIAVVILVAVSIMSTGGSVKENFFHGGARAAEKFAPQDPNAGAGLDVWDQLTEKQEDRK